MLLSKLLNKYLSEILETTYSIDFNTNLSSVEKKRRIKEVIDGLHLIIDQIEEELVDVNCFDSEMIELIGKSGRDIR